MTSPVMSRALTPRDEGWGDELQLREATIGTVDVEAREVVGIGVPFGETIDLWWGRETFDPECEFVGIDEARLLYGHDRSQLLGKLTSWTRTDAGIEVALRVSTTARGDEVLQLVDDEVLRHFSIGFSPMEYLTDDEGLVTHTKVRVREFSLVPFPAYDSAVVTSTRDDNPDHTNPTREDTMTTDMLTRAEFDAQLEARMTDQRREFDTIVAGLRDATPDARLGEQWRSSGEFLKAIAAEDSDALEFYRAFTGGVFADTKTPTTWIADAIKFVDERRPILNSFTRAVLPPEGMSLEFLQVLSNGVQVGKQAAEGDDLAFGKIALTSSTVPVDTYGGYTTLSLQTIKRASSVYLSSAHTAMDLQFAKATEAAVKAFLLALITAQKTAGNKLTSAVGLAAIDLFGWLDLIVDAAELADSRGFTLNGGLRVSKDVLKTMYRLKTSTGEPLLKITSEGRDPIAGVLRASQVSGQIADVEVTLIPGAPVRTVSFADAVAVTTWEQPGAPVQMQDTNVINLTEAFSKHGALAVGSQFPTALIPVEIAA